MKFADVSYKINNEIRLKTIFGYCIFLIFWGDSEDSEKYITPKKHPISILETNYIEKQFLAVKCG